MINDEFIIFIDISARDVCCFFFSQCLYLTARIRGCVFNGKKARNNYGHSSKRAVPANFIVSHYPEIAELERKR